MNTGNPWNHNPSNFPKLKSKNSWKKRFPLLSASLQRGRSALGSPVKKTKTGLSELSREQGRERETMINLLEPESGGRPITAGTNTVISPLPALTAGRPQRGAPRMDPQSPPGLYGY